VLALALVGGLLAPQPSIAPVRWTIPAERKIGKRNAGLLCAPAGALHWRDIGMPDGEESAASIAAALAKSEGAQSYRLSAVITDLKLDICVPNFGGAARLIGLKKVVKGKGTITVAWRIDGGHEQLVQQPIAFGKTETALGDLVLMALADSARTALSMRR
jgi:hypothetical protein